MSQQVICMKCQDYDPTNAFHPRPPCLGLKCHNFLDGCTCASCLARDRALNILQPPPEPKPVIMCTGFNFACRCPDCEFAERLLRARCEQQPQEQQGQGVEQHQEQGHHQHAGLFHAAHDTGLTT